jgi:hypothetical protein
LGLIGCSVGFFFNKKALNAKTKPQKDDVNPYRALASDAFDQGERIGRRADELRRVAAQGLTESEILTALGSATGRQVASMVKRLPNLSIIELLDTTFEGAREHAYIALGLPPENESATELTEQQFNELTNRIVRAATLKTIPNDAICAMAKALGVLISFSARRDGASVEKLVEFSQGAVAQFSQEAVAFMDRNQRA